MSEERERTQIILLRILGVLLIVVGISMLSHEVRSESAPATAIADMLSADPSDSRERCNRRVIHIHEMHAPTPPPPPPAPPAPPAPARVYTF